ncbi:mycothiol transferase [Streptomyces longispororuber]|uniref:mycothiol transferase n=1 Tax=Streptomyces longispororuber TaxID=68230 RepID=UPI0027E5B075|nr:DUF664 domain-containing protein [Streptomyces longispororuber]
MLGTRTGLTAARLAQPALHPSGLTLLALVRHMAEVGRSWFRDHRTGPALPEQHMESVPDTRGLASVKRGV